MLSELGRDEDRCWSLGWKQRRTKQRPNLRMTQSPREVVFQPVARTHGGYINTVALWRASRAHPGCLLSSWSHWGVRLSQQLRCISPHWADPALLPIPCHAGLPHPAWVEQNPWLLLSSVISQMPGSVWHPFGT